MSSAEIKDNISALQKEREEYLLRQSAIQKVLQILNGQFDDDISQARKQNEQIVEYLERGIKGDSLFIPWLCGQIDSVKEKQIWNDTDLSEANENIEAEKKRCDAEVSRLSSEISGLKIQFETALQAEMEEAETTATEN